MPAGPTPLAFTRPSQAHTAAPPDKVRGGRGLCWRELEVTVRGRPLLHPHCGAVGAGRLLGVLGPSGAGKSTLLHALAGVPPARSRVRGEVWAMEESDAGAVVLDSVGVATGTAALLEQDDAFFSELTVRETLEFAAALAGQPTAAAARGASRLLRQVGLLAVADRRVGEPRSAAGASDNPAGGRVTSGERRRLAVACALAGEEDGWEAGCGKAGESAPRCTARLLLADEPTTGLDAFQAARVVALLQQLSAQRRCATVVTLHQPRASIWRMLDDLLLLSPGGHVVYCGPVSDVVPHFTELGHPCPLEGVNPAEFFIDLVSVDTEDPQQAAADRERVASLASAFRGHWRDDGGAAAFVPGSTVVGATREGRLIRAHSGVGPGRAFVLLLKRSVKQNIRDRATNTLRLLASGGLALVFGAHFGKLDNGGMPSARSVASRICLVSFGVIAMAMLATARALDRFSRESAVVGRERTAGCYSGCVYLAAKALTELPTDAAFAGLFAGVVHRQCGLHADFWRVVGMMALVGVCCAALGLAIGAAAPRGERAMAIGAPIMVVHMLTGVIDPAGQAAQRPPAPMRFLRTLSPIRHAIEGLCVAELGGMRLARSAADAPRMGGLALVRTGDEVLRRLEIATTFDGSLSRLALLSVLHLAAAALALAAGRPRRRRDGDFWADGPRRVSAPAACRPSKP